MDKLLELGLQKLWPRKSRWTRKQKHCISI